MQILVTGLIKGFTILEILIVLAIISISGTSFYLILNQPKSFDIYEQTFNEYQTLSIYSGNSYAGGNFGTHISCSLTPSSSNSRVVVMASFQIKRNGNQNNNWYAYAKLAGGGDLQNIEIVRTNGGYSDDTSFKLIAYDAAGNTSSRTYYLQVKHSSTSSSYSSVSIRHASIVAIELSSS